MGVGERGGEKCRAVHFWFACDCELAHVSTVDRKTMKRLRERLEVVVFAIVLLMVAVITLVVPPVGEALARWLGLDVRFDSAPMTLRSQHQYVGFQGVPRVVGLGLGN